ncbi:hypothetical protein JTB14_030743 [Gonioctena quinquepunctata]|nr:hypothetical protein JTB14_030743 [Gonioctena quinquepunctata]
MYITQQKGKSPKREETQDKGHVKSMQNKLLWSADQLELVHEAPVQFSSRSSQHPSHQSRSAWSFASISANKVELERYGTILIKMAKDETFTVLLVLTLLDLASSNLYLSRTSSIINEGDSMAVVCKDEGGQLVTWRGPRGPLRANTQPSVQDTSIGKLLKFNSSKVEHTGNYTCSLSNNADVKRVFTLIVGKTIKFVDTQEKQRGQENQDYLMRCEAEGNVEMSVSIENEELQEPKFVKMADGLLIRNVSLEDGDKSYICQARQSLTGDFSTVNIKLIVEHKPKPLYEEYEKDVEVYGFLGEYTNLTCSVIAEPPPKFNWVKKAGKNYETGSHEPVLQVLMTERAEGEYQCIASNKHGKLITIFNLHVGKRPEPPLGIELKNTTSDELTMSIGLPLVSEEDLEIEMDPKWLVIQYRTKGSEDWSCQEFNISQPDVEASELKDPEEVTTTAESPYEMTEIVQLSNLEPKTVYEVTAATRNIASLSEFTNSSYFETSKATQYVHTNSVLVVVLVNSLILFVSTPA